VYVTAVDADELESEPSAAIAIPPPTAGPVASMKKTPGEPGRRGPRPSRQGGPSAPLKDG